MTGWDATRRVHLDAPWEDFWLDIYEDPAIAVWLNLKEVGEAGLRDPRMETIEKACLAVKPVIAGHNLTDRDGKPIEIELRALSVGLFKAVVLRILRELQAGADPKPNRAQRRERSSPKPRSRSASASSS